MSDLLWVAVPSGLAGGAPLLRVLVVPRLDTDGTLADHGLGTWPPDALREGTVRVLVGATPEDATAHDVTPRLDADPAVWAAFLGPEATVRAAAPAPPRPVEVAPTAEQADRVVATYRNAAQALRDAEDHTDFHATVRSEVAAYADAGGRVTPPAPAPPRAVVPPDAHRTLGLLREHPAVLRALGLILDVPLPAGALPAAATGVVSVEWPGRPESLPPVVSRWTRYRRETFLPDAAGADADHDAGMLRLARPHWRLHALDVDTALGRLRDAALATEPGGSLPALRTAGVLLVRAGRGDELATRQDTGRANRAAADAPLTADDLVLGYRLDVRVFGADEWRSLCRRVATYEVDGRTIAKDLREEGHVKPRAAVDHGDAVLRADEVVARWDGWSLAAPRPSAARDAARAANGNDLPFDFRVALDAEPGTLPRLRFGTLYQLRARLADVAGGGRPLDDPSPDGTDSAPFLFTRHEPVSSPGVTLPDGVAAGDLGPGATVALLVVRGEGGADDKPADPTRVLLPPLTTLDVAERHGVLDGPASEAGAHVRGDLPDPAAAGVAAFLRAEPGGPVADIEPSSWAAPWPRYGTKTVTVRARDGKAPTLLWQGNDLAVNLGPAEQVTIELSSFLRDGLVPDFAVHDWMPRAGDGDEPGSGAVTAAQTGRHPMVTPARAVTAVHAVRKPLAEPAGTFDAERLEAATFAVLTPRPADLAVDAASTATLHVTASWQEFDDDGDRPVTGAPVDVLQVARGDTALPPIRHELADTKHRRVTYTLTAVTRFRQFFTGGTDADYQQVGHTAEVPLLSTARPVPPVVLSVVPAFVWSTEEGDGVVVRRRLGNRARVELARPWFTTGEGEALAVLTVPGEPPPHLRDYVTHVGRDPLRDTPVPSLPELPGDDRTLAENGAVVRATPFGAWRSGDSWYADVVLPDTGSYAPLARLAVARYQPSSVGALHLSPVVRTDYVPLLPDRTLTVDVSRFAATREVDVLLEGRGPDGPPGTRIDVSAEQCTDPAGGAGLLAFPPDDGATPAWVSVVGGGARLGERATFTMPPDLRPLRLRIREVELFAADEDEGAIGGDSELTQRTVFTDVVNLPD
jgi:hypothetical protein